LNYSNDDGDDDDDDDERCTWCVRVMYVQGENSKETEAWFNIFSKALQVGIYSQNDVLVFLLSRCQMTDTLIT